MTRPNAAELEAAKRVLAVASARPVTAVPYSASVEAYELLRSTFAQLIGVDGVRALMARSVRVNMLDVPSLADIAGPGAYRHTLAQTEEKLLDCFRELDSRPPSAAPNAAAEVAVPLFATFLNLMITFVGERLVWHLLRSAGVDLDDVVVKETEQ